MTNYGDEHIAELIPTALLKSPKQDLYTSKYRPSIKTQVNNEKFPAKTMGMIATTPPNAKNYLKKDQGHKALRLKIKLATGNKSPRKTQKKKSIKSSGLGLSNFLPKIDRLDVENSKNSQNCKITENAIRNITSIPKLPKKIYVDSNNGNKNDLLTSGLVPRYSIQKETFGQIPKYIIKRKNLVQQTQKDFDNFIYNQSKNSSLKKVDINEHNEILNCLKDKWSKLHHEYQGLSVVTDTAPKKNRKEKLENAMSQIEKDITFFERHRKIYVERF